MLNLSRPSQSLNLGANAGQLSSSQYKCFTKHFERRQSSDPYAILQVVSQAPPAIPEPLHFLHFHTAPPAAEHTESMTFTLSLETHHREQEKYGQSLAEDE
jgi:hypothetical protein